MIKVISIDGVEPVTLSEAKQQCHIPPSDNDSTTEDLLTSIIKAARLYGESRTWRRLVDATLEMTLDCFPRGIIEVPQPPLICVESVKYIDEAEDEQTLSEDAYRVDRKSEPGRIEPANDWPSTHDRINAVTIRFKAGYKDTEVQDGDNTTNCPEDIQIALKMYIKYLYDNRDSFVFPERSATEYTEAPLGTNMLLDMKSVGGPV